MSETAKQQDQRVEIPWDDFVRFLRQVSHDIRNHLNAAELQTAYLNEIAENPELKEEVKRLREMIGEVSKSLQKIIGKVTPINITPIPYGCADLIEDVKQKLASAKWQSTVQWDVQLGNEMFEVDPQLLQDAILELFENANRHEAAGPTTATAKIAGNQFEFVLREPKKEFTTKTEGWGREPARTVGRGHYGLGLNRVRMIVEAHQGSFVANYDPQSSSLLSRIVIPLQASE